MLQKFFGFDPKVHSVRTECIAGVTTFLSMAYILAVNPGIFSALADKGMPTDAVFTATALAALIGTLVMAVYAKKPFGLAPGMGLNAFFVYTVCLTMGYSWQFALTAILIEGVIFILMTISNLREAIANAIPLTMKKAIAAGIGLFIAFIGLKGAGIVVDNPATLVGMGKFNNAGTLLAVFGFVLMGTLVILRVKSAILLGILAVTLLGIPFGVTKMNGVMSTPPSIAPIFCQFEWSQVMSLDMVVVVFTFLFIDLFDTIGTVVGVSMKAGMIDEKGRIPGIKQTLMADAVATVAGACLGTSTTTTYVESASGVSAGGRTGLTAFVTALCFAVSLLFAPLFLAVPGVATAPALVIVGVFMMGSMVDIDYEDYSEFIPAFITLAMMPLTYSIANGIMAGMLCYVVLNAVSGHMKKLSPLMWILGAAFLGYFIFHS